MTSSPALSGWLRRTLRGPVRWVRRLLTRWSLRRAAAAGRLRIMVGAGPVRLEGWVATDIDSLDLLREESWGSVLRTESVAAILAEHVWEHLDEAEGREAARICFKYLQPGGYLRVAVPDGLHPDPAYLDLVAPPADGHRVLFDYRTLASLFEQAGFEVRLLEYYDESGIFHGQDWSLEEGRVTRSRKVCGRAPVGGFDYTSVLLDARKPGRR